MFIISKSDSDPSFTTNRCWTQQRAIFFLEHAQSSTQKLIIPPIPGGLQDGQRNLIVHVE